MLVSSTYTIPVDGVVLILKLSAHVNQSAQLEEVPLQAFDFVKKSNL